MLDLFNQTLPFNKILPYCISLSLLKPLSQLLTPLSFSNQVRLLTMHWVWNFKVHQTCTGTKTSNSFELQNVCVFVPVQVSCKVKFKTQCIVRFVLRYSFHCLQIYCASTCIVYFPCNVLKSQVHFLQRVYKLNINLILFRARFWFQGTCSFVPFEILLY